MSGIDLDAMRDRWTASNRKVDEQLSLDVDAMRAALAARTQAAFRRHSIWLAATLPFAAITLVALLAFMLSQWHDWRYLLMAAPLTLLALGEFTVALRQWLALSRLDFTAPLLQVRAELDVLRARRLWMTKWILLTSVLLWWPAIMVLVKGLFGGDMLAVLPPGFLLINLGIGLAFIPLAMLAAHLVTRRFSGSSGFQRFLQDMAGRSWSRAQDELEANARFEARVETDGAEQALQARHAKPSTDSSHAVNALKRRLMLATVGYASLMTLTGVFNAMHGGEPHFIMAGVLLYLVWLPQMVGSILHRNFVARLDFSAAPEQIRAGLAEFAAMRAGLVRWTIALLPLLLLPLAHAMAQQGLGLDGFAWLPVPAIAVTTSVAVLISWVLIRRMRRAPESFFPRFVDVLMFGVLARTKALSGTLNLS